LGSPEGEFDSTFCEILDKVGIDFDFEGEIIRELHGETFYKIGALGLVVVKIEGKEGEKMGDIFSFIRNIFTNLFLVDMKLT
jgi:hypothetical protein